MNKAFILLICFPLTFISAQTSYIDIDSNSSFEIFEGSTICIDSIIVHSGSSFIAYDYGQVNESDCTTLLTPTGDGTITLPIELTDIESLPKEFILKSAYPNPFNPTTTIHYGIPDIRNVTILVYDLMGRKVATLFHDEQQAGWYKVTWNGLINNRSLAPAGIYLYKITAGDEIKTSKILLIK